MYSFPKDNLVTLLVTLMNGAVASGDDIRYLHTAGIIYIDDKINGGC